MQPLVIILTRLLVLQVLTRPYILSALGESHEIKSLHELCITFFAYHFSIERKTVLKPLLKEKALLNSIKRKTVEKQNREHRRDNISNKSNTGKRKKNGRFNRNLVTQQRKIKNKRRKENYCNKITEIKANPPDQNAINLSTATLTEAQKSLLMKGLSFVPTPSDVNWY